MAKFGFNVAEVDPSAQGSFEPLPAGDYCLKAIESEEKDTKSSGGKYIKVVFEVVKGDFAGRKIYFNFNTVNANAKAQQIGHQQLVAWATACGKPTADDTDKLMDRPFMCTVAIEKGTGGYKDDNTIKAFLFDKDDAPAPAVKTSAPAKSAPAKAAAGKGTNPWD